MPRIRTILIAGATLYIVLSTFVATVNHVPTTSMENTIKAGSVIPIDPITYGARPPPRVADIALAKNVLFLVPLSVFGYGQRTE